MKIIAALFLAALLAACGVLPVSPERQIRDGANTVNVTATVAGSLLQVDKITKAQAVNYRSMLDTVSRHLDTAFAVLAACRAKTGSTQATAPDPCKASVQQDIDLAVTVAAEVKKVLDAKR